MFTLDLCEWFSAIVHISLTYLLVTFLHLIIPARSVRGYVHDGPSFYRLNGLKVFFIVNGIFFLSAGYFQLINLDYLVKLRTKHAFCACMLGITLTFILVLPHPKRSFSFWLEIYLGRLKNPQWFGDRVDAKMLLYLIGGIGLELNLIVFYFEHKHENSSNMNIVLYFLLFTFFLTEYFYHEHVHLYTFDFLVEYVGFKLVWGCLVFYPFFYPIAIWCSIRPTSLSLIRLCLSIFIFLLGWILSRGANNQKYLFRTQPTAKFLGFIQPKSINGRLLCSGWWAFSRHINYLGDILMAVGLTLSLNGGVIRLWFYPLYYVSLFLVRERTDFKRCQDKYGQDWNEYCRQVPYRIVPYFY